MNWTLEQRKNFGNEYVLTCKFFDKDISIEIVKLVVYDLQDLDFQACFNALSVFRKSAKNQFWPKSADIRKLASPELSDESKAEQAAVKIVEAIKKYGWSQPEQARAHMGELAWNVVLSKGGWLAVCENHGCEWDAGTFHAQARQIAKSTIESAKLGVLNLPIGLPEPNQENISRVMKLIEPKTIE